MKSQTRFAAAALLVLCAIAAARPQVPALTTDRTQKWREDLEYFADQFPRRHADFSKVFPQPAFNGELAEIEADIPRLTDAGIYLKMMRLVARANIDHTKIYASRPEALGLHRLPVSLAWYADGAGIYSAAPEYANVLGTHVLRIGSKTPEELVTELAPYISHENDAWLRQQSPGMLTTVEVLRQLGAVDSDGGVPLMLAKPGSGPFTVTVQPSAEWDAQTVNMFDALHLTPPLNSKRNSRNQFYWYEYLPDSQAIYLQYNRCEDDVARPFAVFVRDLFTFVDSHPVQRMVLDLRSNGGGNSRVIDPLVNALKLRPRLRANISVLIGPGTFSSASLNALALRRELHVPLMGESNGEKPNGYGEVGEFVLPNSGLHVTYSKRFFRLIQNADPPALEPDVRTPRATLADALAGRDPTLDAVLNTPLKR